jgi:cystathionine gamma-synthase
MASIHAALASLPENAHIIVPDDVYYGVRSMLDEKLADSRLQYTVVDFSSRDAVEQALRPNTRMLWVESPSNPACKITDIQLVAELAARADALLVVDGTWTTPLLQQPLKLGAHIVMHSVTKYLAGHSDVLGGALVFRERNEYSQKVKRFQHLAGAVLDPFSCWLTLRGLRSLGARMRSHLENAEAVANFLQDHPKVSVALYPGLASHPGHEIAARQMSGFGGMASFLVDGSAEYAVQVASRVKVFKRATSLGGTESLIEHRQSIEGPGSATPGNLLRLSMGLEHADDLISDLDRALSRI